MKFFYLFLFFVSVLCNNNPIYAQSCGAVGSVIITEVGPRTSNDPNAEWLELYNTTNSTINLTGWIIADESGSSPYTINAVNGNVLIPAGGFLVFSYGNAFNTVFSPATTNHVYGALNATGGSTMTMSSCNDGVEITCGGVQISDLYYATNCPSTNQSVQTTSVPAAIANGGVITNSNYTLAAASPGSAGGTVLPIELLHFSAKMMDQAVEIAWETASEFNNAGFELERSTDGVLWKSLTFVEGSEFRTESKNYAWIDYAPEQGRNYYRLKQVDFDGSVSYSSIEIVVNKSTKFAFNLNQNPVASILDVNVLSLESEKILSIEVVNMLGQVLSKSNFSTINGDQSFQIVVDQLTQGLYYVRVVDENQGILAIRQFVKQ